MESIQMVVEAEMDHARPGEQFSYSDEPLGPNEIRVISLLPDCFEEDESDIHCHIFRLDLSRSRKHNESQHPIIALSYVWGPTEPAKRILVNGRWKTINPNLYDALQRLRRKLAPVPLWIDAICINQASIEERNREIRKMGDIYANAWMVIFWLGPAEGDDSSEMVNGHLGYAAKTLAEVSDIWLALVEEGSQEAEHNPWTVWTSLATKRYDGANAAMQSCLFYLYSLAFWKRVWITQELVLAKRGMFVWGDHVFDLRLLEAQVSVRHLYVPHPIFSIQVNEGIDTFSMIMDTLSMRSTRSVRLLQALVNARYRHARDPHDYIYGLSGIANLTQQGIRPDYEASVESVYVEATSIILKQEKNLDFLSACERGWNKMMSHDEESDTWPTWLPDWSCRPLEHSDVRELDDRERGIKIQSVLLDGATYAELAFRACGDTEHVASVSPDGKHFKCRGVNFDTVDDIIGTQGEHWEAKVKRSWDDGRLTNVYPSLQSLRNACRSLAAFGRDERVFLSRVFEHINQVFRDDQVQDTSAAVPFNASKAGREPFDQEAAAIPGDPMEAEIDRVRLPAQLDESPSWYFFTKRGYVGRSPVQPRPGDTIAILFGGKVPLLLRRSMGRKLFCCVGEAYIYGIMKGAALEAMKDEWEDFILI